MRALGNGIGGGPPRQSGSGPLATRRPGVLGYRGRARADHPTIVPSLPFPESWPDAALLLAILAAAPPAFELHLLIEGPAGPARDRLIEQLRAALPLERAIGRCGPATDPDRVFGGTALADSLLAGRPIARSALVDELAGGVMLLSAASREPAFAAQLLAALERAPVSLVVLADGRGDPDGAAAGMAVPADRLPLRLALDDAVLPPDLPAGLTERVGAAAERLRAPGLPTEDAENAGLAALCEAAVRCGIASLRAPMAAWRAARVLAALHGRDRVLSEDVALAARLMLPPWAGEPAASPPDPSGAPSAEAAKPDPASEPAGAESNHTLDGDGAARDPADSDDEAGAPGGEAASVVLDAIQAALPPGLLDRVGGGASSARGAEAGGRGAASRVAVARAGRGRSAGIRAGRPPADGRLALFATLCAALPWQRLRVGPPGGNRPGARLRLHPSDLRVRRTVRVPRRVTILVVDASGSAARERLREAKGAAELLLAECYRRRDRVALIAFRDRGATLVVPPTGSLTLARRRLLGLPAGGGTPLAAGLREAVALANRIAREGCTPMLVLLTDARGNVALDGAADRSRAEQDALAAARLVAERGWPSLLIDISPRPDSSPGSRAARLAAALRGSLVPLPRGRANAVAALVRDAAGG